MNPPESPPERLPLRSLYTIAELARAAKVDRRTIQRIMAEYRIELIGTGRSQLVPLSEIITKLKVFWDSVEASQEVVIDTNRHR